MATLGIDLSRLTVADLLRLREAAERRGETELIAELSAALAARRRAPGQAVAVRLGQPLEGAWSPRPETGEEVEPAPGWRWATVAAAAVACVLLAAGVGWRLSRPEPAPTPDPQAAAPASPAVAALREAPASVGPAPAATPHPPVAARARAHAPSPRRAEARRGASRPVAAAPRRTPSCAIGTGTADRIVCGDPRLAAEHAAMLAAYDRALDAGASSPDVDAGQAAWRAVRARARDPDTLAGLYRRRIAELEAAAREARRTR